MHESVEKPTKTSTWNPKAKQSKLRGQSVVKEYGGEAGAASWPRGLDINPGSPEMQTELWPARLVVSVGSMGGRVGNSTISDGLLPRTQSQIYSFHLKLKTSEIETRRKTKFWRRKHSLRGGSGLILNARLFTLQGPFFYCVFWLCLGPLHAPLLCPIYLIWFQCSLNEPGQLSPAHLLSPATDVLDRAENKSTPAFVFSRSSPFLIVYFFSHLRANKNILGTV